MAFRKQVFEKRRRRGHSPAVDELDSLLDTVHSNNGENGAKDLLLHELGAGAGLINNGGLEEAVLDVGLATKDDIVAHLVQVALETGSVPLIDDAGVAGGLLGVLSEPLLDLLPQHVDQRLLQLLLHQDVVRSDAGLAHVQELAPMTSKCEGSEWTSNGENLCWAYKRMRLVATSRLQERSTMQGDLPPSSRVTGVRCSAAALITIFPTSVLPV